LYYLDGDVAPKAMSLDTAGALDSYHERHHLDRPWTWTLQLPLQPRDFSQLRSLILELFGHSNMYTCSTAKRIVRESVLLKDFRITLIVEDGTHTQSNLADTTPEWGTFTSSLLPQPGSSHGLASLTVLHLKGVPLANCRQSWFVAFDFTHLKHLRLELCYAAEDFLRSFAAHLRQNSVRASLESLIVVNILFADMDLVDDLLMSFEGLTELQLTGAGKRLTSSDALCQHSLTLRILSVDISVWHPLASWPTYATIQHHMYAIDDVSLLLERCDKLEELGLAMCVMTAKSPSGFRLVKAGAFNLDDDC
jgi:hypothetical protein